MRAHLRTIHNTIDLATPLAHTPTLGITPTRLMALTLTVTQTRTPTIRI